jgi:hypothetical protein
MKPEWRIRGVAISTFFEGSITVIRNFSTAKRAVHPHVDAHYWRFLSVGVVWNGQMYAWNYGEFYPLS